MVYCGKPSKGCGQCRTRKIRCDQTRPACSQCVRAKRECPGYRDQLALMFRDESTAVIRKAKAEGKAENKKASSSKTSSPPHSSSVSPRSSNSPEPARRTASPEGNSASGMALDVGPDVIELPFDFNNMNDPIPPYALSTSSYSHSDSIPMEVQPLALSEEDAICFFMRCNAFPGTFWMTEYMWKFMSTQSESGGAPSWQAMRSGMVAVASAMLSRVRKVDTLRAVARKEYCSALESLNTALANPEEARSNQALGAVVLLAIYEVRQGSAIDMHNPI